MYCARAGAPLGIPAHVSTSAQLARLQAPTEWLPSARARHRPSPAPSLHVLVPIGAELPAATPPCCACPGIGTALSASAPWTSACVMASSPKGATPAHSMAASARCPRARHPLRTPAAQAQVRHRGEGAVPCWLSGCRVLPAPCGPDKARHAHAALAHPATFLGCSHVVLRGSWHKQAGAQAVQLQPNGEHRAAGPTRYKRAARHKHSTASPAAGVRVLAVPLHTPQAWTLGLGHTCGHLPERVPQRMRNFVAYAREFAPGQCFSMPPVPAPPPRAPRPPPPPPGPPRPGSWANPVQIDSLPFNFDIPVRPGCRAGLQARLR